MNPETPQAPVPAPTQNPSPGPSEKNFFAARIVLYVFTILAISILIFLNYRVYQTVTNDNQLGNLILGSILFVWGIPVSVLGFYSVKSLLHKQIKTNRRVAGFSLLMTSIVLSTYWSLSFVFPAIIPSAEIVPWLVSALPIAIILSFIHGFTLYFKGTLQKTA